MRQQINERIMNDIQRVGDVAHKAAEASTRLSLQDIRDLGFDLD